MKAKLRAGLSQVTIYWQSRLKIASKVKNAQSGPIVAERQKSGNKLLVK